MNEIPHPGFDKPEEYETFTTTNGLEEAAENHIRRVADAAGHPGWDWTTQDIAEAFIAGYNLCREQMLKEAVEVCNVVEEGRYCQEIGPIFLDERAGFKPGDKVRIIVIPNTDEK